MEDMKHYPVPMPSPAQGPLGKIQSQYYVQEGL